jgi:predicted nuclease of predicted toxin-antitoxin system
MRILIDECVDQRLRLLFPGHDCETAAYAKLSGLKNGALLAAAEAVGFEVIITTDQEIPYQQNLSTRQISIIVLCAPTNRLVDLKRLVPDAIRTLGSIKAGEVIRIT